MDIHKMLQHDIKDYFRYGGFGFIDKNSKEYREEQEKKGKPLSVVDEEEELLPAFHPIQSGQFLPSAKKVPLSNERSNNGNKQSILASSDKEHGASEKKGVTSVEQNNQEGYPADITFQKPESKPVLERQLSQSQKPYLRQSSASHRSQDQEESSYRSIKQDSHRSRSRSKSPMGEQSHRSGGRRLSESMLGLARHISPETD